MSIRAKHYEESVKELMKDEIIIHMALELPKDIWESILESWEFIRSALAEYQKRGGKVKTHIGGPSEAISKVKKILISGDIEAIRGVLSPLL